MADTFSQFEALLREQIEPRVHDLVLPTDDAAWNLIGTFQPETLAGKDPDGYAGFFAEWRCRVQRGGLVSGGRISGNTMNMVGKDSHLPAGHATVNSFLDPLNTPHRGYINVKMALKRILGSLTINRTQILADLATNPIEEVAGDYVEDAVFQLRQMITNNFWGNGQGEVGKVAAAPASNEIVTTAGGVAITIKDGTPFRFVKGQRYSFGAAPADPYSGTYTFRDGATSSATGVARCVDIDVENRTASFQAETASGKIELVAADDSIFVAGTVDDTASNLLEASDPESAGSLVSNGVHGLLISSGTFPGTAYNVANHTELKAWLDGDADNPVMPTPEIVAKLTDRITDAGLTPPSALIAEQSIWTLWSQFERQSGATYMVPQGAQFQASGGVTAGPNVGHGNHTFARLSSSICRPNTIYGLSPDTWKKFMPLGDRSIRWVYSTGPLAGHGSIFGPTYAATTNRLTELADAPFEAFCQFGLTDPRRNFIYSGVSNQRDL